MAEPFSLGVCIPQGSEFQRLEQQIRLAVEEAQEQLLNSSSQRIAIDVELLPEPCGSNSQQSWYAKWSSKQAVVGPLCSLHASEILGNWPSGELKVVMSPGADLASLSVSRASLPFFRVCGDAGRFASEFGRLISAEIQASNLAVIYDTSNRWWAEVAHELRRSLVFLYRKSARLYKLGSRTARQDLVSFLEAQRYTSHDLVCFLGESPGSVSEVLDLLKIIFAENENLRLWIPRQLSAVRKAAITDWSLADGRVYSFAFQAPELSSAGNSHLRKLRRRLGREPNPYVAQVYDALLLVVEAARRLTEGDLPGGLLPNVINDLSFEGCTGRIEFDNFGNRRDQGTWTLEILRGATFLPVKKEVEDTFDRLRLHSAIRRASERLFKDGHYAQAVFEAFKYVTSEVKRVSGQTELDGKGLMGHVFNEQDPLVKLNEIADRTERAEQEGFKFLFMGSSLGIRDPLAHEAAITGPDEALEYLSLASMLLKRLDRRVAPD